MIPPEYLAQSTLMHWMVVGYEIIRRKGSSDGEQYEPNQSPATFQSPAFQSFATFQRQNVQQGGMGSPVQQMSPQIYQALVSPSTYDVPQYYN